jgi:nucleoside 2-deoxyribosyltransferase
MNIRIYFAGAILGGRDNLAVYQHIVARLQSLGHSVPTEHVAHADVLKEESGVSARAVYDRDMNWIRECDAMIAEVSTPSLGVGYEIACALERGKPVLCLYRDGLFISKMITGNPSAQLRVLTYRELLELDRHIDAFLANIIA